MSLINCPECGKEISDKAVSCPNCGCPITSSQEKTDDSKVIETNTQIEKSQSVQSKKIVSIVSVAIAVVVIIFIAIFVGKNISKKKAQAKKDQQIQEVKNAMDNVDSSLGDLFTAMVPDEPFLYGDSSSDTYKNKITGILDTITENQKIVEDAYKNEDRDFIKELDDYISTNKTYRSWDEYNAEIKKLYGDSISNEQAADSLVKEMASSEEEYYDFKNDYFVMYDYETDERYKLHFDPEGDFIKYSSKDGDKTFGYRIKDVIIKYMGNGNPNDLVLKFTLYGTGGDVIGEKEWDIYEQKGNGTIYGADGKSRISYRQVYGKKFQYGDNIRLSMLEIESEINDTPTDIKMTVISSHQD